MIPRREASLGSAAEIHLPIADAAGRLLRRCRAPFMAVADAVAVSGACFAAYVLRFHSATVAAMLPVKEAVPDLVSYGVITLLMTTAWTFLMWQEGMYRNSLRSMRSMSDELFVVLSAGFHSLAVVMVGAFLYRTLVISRIFLTMAFVLALGLVLLLRLLLGYVLKRLASRDVLLEKFVLLGASPASRKIIDRFRALRPLARITGRIGLTPGDAFGQPRPDGLPILGDASNIDAIIEDRRITGVIFTSAGYDYESDPEVREALIRTVNCCEAKGMPFYMIPDALNVVVRENEVGSCCGLPVIELRDAAAHPLYGAAKRVVDVLVAAVVLFAGLPLWLAIATAVKLTSEGPVLFVQERVNRDGKVFRMYKFRTMVRDASSRLGDLVDFDSLSEPVFKIRNDPRVTPVGRLLRRTGMDEIPQLFNVLMGDMSLVGPRPEQVELVERYDAWQRRRLKARPGITGYQQVMNRGEPSLEQRIHYDLIYLKRQSLLFDLLIILKTFVVIIKGDGIP